MARNRATISLCSFGVVARLGSSVTSNIQSFILIKPAAGCSGSKPLGDRVKASPCRLPASLRDFLVGQYPAQLLVRFRDVVADQQHHFAIRDAKCRQRLSITSWETLK